MSVWLLITEEQTLDQWAFIKLHFSSHFLHVENSVMLIEPVGDLEVGKDLEALLPVGNNNLGHVGII
jgi:hypothetical protein